MCFIFFLHAESEELGGNIQQANKNEALELREIVNKEVRLGTIHGVETMTRQVKAWTKRRKGRKRKRHASEGDRRQVTRKIGAKLMQHHGNRQKNLTHR